MWKKAQIKWIWHVQLFKQIVIGVLFEHCVPQIVVKLKCSNLGLIYICSLNVTLCVWFKCNPLFGHTYIVSLLLRIWMWMLSGSFHKLFPANIPNSVYHYFLVSLVVIKRKGLLYRFSSFHLNVSLTVVFVSACHHILWSQATSHERETIYARGLWVEQDGPKVYVQLSRCSLRWKRGHSSVIHCLLIRH